MAAKMAAHFPEARRCEPAHAANVVPILRAPRGPGRAQKAHRIRSPILLPARHDSRPRHVPGRRIFATNMHSVAISGSLAWWNPIAKNGYAQYFLAFLSPVAPTPHNIAFIAFGLGRERG